MLILAQKIKFLPLAIKDWVAIEGNSPTIEGSLEAQLHEVQTQLQ